MKRKTARELIAESFRELADRKSIDKITVQEIVENCGYSSATFYRCFADKYDLIAWDHTRGVAEIMDRIDGVSYTWQNTLLDGARSFYEQREYLVNLFQHTAGQDSFIRHMTEINENALKKHILSLNEGRGLDKNEEMYLHVYCLGTVLMTCEWLMGKHDLTPEQVARIYEGSLPQALKRHLYKE